VIEAYTPTAVLFELLAKVVGSSVDELRNSYGAALVPGKGKARLYLPGVELGVFNVTIELDLVGKKVTGATMLLDLEVSDQYPQQRELYLKELETRFGPGVKSKSAGQEVWKHKSVTVADLRSVNKLQIKVGK
jgi:hypothetical protein